MKKRNLLPFICCLCGIGTLPLSAQTASTSDNLTAQPATNRVVPFRISDEGVSKPIIWGFDLAWRDENNLRRGIAFSDVSLIGIVRSSFTPTSPIVNGKLGTQELEWLNYRLNALKMIDPNRTKVMLNSDSPTIDEWFYPLDEKQLEKTPFISDPEKRKTRAERWAELIEITTRAHQKAGYTVVSVAPFNEPDYIYNLQCTKPLFNDVVLELMENPLFDDIRISAGNTLNTDPAWEWYDYMKKNSRADEGNTHQLAGYFPQYADFFTKVRASGGHATNDELHNVMEAMVGVEYGMQTGIWWGTADYSRGSFMKASEGKRLAYAEHRDNWTSASVYRYPEGQVQAFVGASERQASTTSYRFISKEQDVYFDGHGPQREFIVEIPGGNGYGINQPGAERVVNITWGDDIQPVIDGRYILVNRGASRVMAVSSSVTAGGAPIVMVTNRNNSIAQEWNVTPVDSRIGGDFSYFTFTSAQSGKAIDLLNYSLNNSASIIVYNDAKGANQQWFLEYAEDGWFYIRSRHSAKCLEVSGIAAGSSVVQKDKSGDKKQQWRFLPVTAPVEFIAPTAPTGLTATANASSIQLDWNTSPEADVAGYSVFRSEAVGGPYNTIARNVISTSFVDNTPTTGKAYYYAVKAADNSLNYSEYSNEVPATSTGENNLLARFTFEGNSQDVTQNRNHSAIYGTATFAEGKTGSQALELDGTKNFIQLPATLPHQPSLTVATWVYWKGNTASQYIFDFGNGEDEYIALTPRSGSNQISFSMKKGDLEQRLNAAVSYSIGLRNNWVHMAVTLDESAVRLYLNGQKIAESTSFTLNPADIKPILNYIGRSQNAANPLFSGNIDDFRVYNYALSANEIVQIAENPSPIAEVEDSEEHLSLWPLPAKDVLHLSYADENAGPLSLSIYTMDSRLVISKSINNEADLDVSALPSGLYLLKLTSQKETIVKEFLITH